MSKQINHLEMAGWLNNYLRMCSIRCIVEFCSIGNNKILQILAAFQKGFKFFS